jgi:hypothetical protein
MGMIEGIIIILASFLINMLQPHAIIGTLVLCGFWWLCCKLIDHIK